MANDAQSDAVRETARRHAPDFYVAALLAPPEHRQALLAIAALAGELARIPAEVSEPMLAEIRVQWWRDALATRSANARTGHPVADAIAALGCDPAHVIALVDAATAREAATAAFALAAQSLELNGEDVARTILPAGEAYGDARDLALAAAHGAPVAPSARDTVRRALQATREALRHAPPATLTAILPVALVEPYLRVSQLDADGARRHLATLLPLKRVVRLWFARATGRL